MKRFYKEACAAADGGVLLDGKAVKTPAGAALRAPTEALAVAVAQEWAAQETEILPDTMPLTQLLTTAQDGAAARASVTETMLSYAGSDLLCYRVDHPAALAQLQAELRDPWLDWFIRAYGVTPATTTGLSAVPQPPALRATISEKLDGLDMPRFTVCQTVTALTGSAILALALLDGAATPGDLLAATNMEEDFKAALYNEAEHGSAPHQEKKQAALKRDIEASARFLSLLG